MLGREIGATFYGLGSDDSLLAPGVIPGIPRLIEFKSNYFDFPILEYRTYRAFDTTQTSELILQLFGGVDVPYGESVVFPPGAPGVDLDRVYSIGMRLVFDWRRYSSTASVRSVPIRCRQSLVSGGRFGSKAADAVAQRGVSRCGNHPLKAVL